MWTFVGKTVCFSVLLLAYIHCVRIMNVGWDKQAEGLEKPRRSCKNITGRVLFSYRFYRDKYVSYIFLGSNNKVAIIIQNIFMTMVLK